MVVLQGLNHRLIVGAASRGDKQVVAVSCSSVHQLNKAFDGRLCRRCLFRQDRVESCKHFLLSSAELLKEKERGRNKTQGKKK